MRVSQVPDFTLNPASLVEATTSSARSIIKTFGFGYFGLSAMTYILTHYDAHQAKSL